MKNDLLRRLDELTDTQTGLVIQVAKTHPEIADRLHAACMAWIALAWDIAGEKPHPLDTLKRRLENEAN